ncbi:hypothetical protein HUU62_08800 [Rhodoferax sp. 4810]|uniref:Uncharacterized protein n=1 Tax=Thiospirillum jenense TaxID=1653858 RepID=A0A839HE33_9GAMM|nr:hypothetical protein [Thiospirillum jenense]MBB1074508.1 hypothetical protein [Rhodoferax jenense]MBB1125508.1 hypothetical protein [Thiospirillum jenense]
MKTVKDVKEKYPNVNGDTPIIYDGHRYLSVNRLKYFLEEYPYDEIRRKLDCGIPHHDWLTLLGIVGFNLQCVSRDLLIYRVTLK